MKGANRAVGALLFRWLRSPPRVPIGEYDLVHRWTNSRRQPSTIEMSTNSPGEHFIVDTLKDHLQVGVVAGHSWHGFEYCGVVGEIMADLADHGETSHNVDTFTMSRFDSR